jgi:lipopolysaccharide transport system permease protein
MEKHTRWHRAGAVLAHRSLLYRFTRRNIERQTKGSWLGLLWFLLNPLLMLGLYSVVFGLIMGGDFRVVENPGPFDFPLGVFIGLTILGLITETMGQSPTLIVSSQNLVKKVVFPLQILPMALVASIFFKTLISSCLALLAIFLVRGSIPLEAVWFPLILLPVFLFALGISWLFSAFGVYFRDSQQLTAFLGTATFYASAVFYPASRIPDPIYAWLQYNPVLQAVELSRDVLLWQLPFSFQTLGFLWVSGLTTCLLGYFCFQGLRQGFADVL